MEKLHPVYYHILSINDVRNDEKDLLKHTKNFPNAFWPGTWKHSLFFLQVSSSDSQNIAIVIPNAFFSFNKTLPVTTPPVSVIASVTLNFRESNLSQMDSTPTYAGMY